MQWLVILLVPVTGYLLLLAAFARFHPYGRAPIFTPAYTRLRLGLYFHAAALGSFFLAFFFQRAIDFFLPCYWIGQTILFITCLHLGTFKGARAVDPGGNELKLDSVRQTLWIAFFFLLSIGVVQLGVAWIFRGGRIG